MAIIIHIISFKIKPSVNTPDYTREGGKYYDKNWKEMHKIKLLPTCDKKYWKWNGTDIVEMTQGEKDEYEFNTNSSVFFIDSHTLKTNIDGRFYTEDVNALLNPIIPEGGIEYGVVINGDELVEVLKEERIIIDEGKAVKEAEKIEKERCKNIADEITLTYTPADEIAFNRKLHTEESKLTDSDIMTWLKIVQAAKAKYPKVQL